MPSPRKIRHRLLRRKRSWSKPIILPKNDTPEYGQLLATLWGPRIVRKTMGGILNALVKGGSLKRQVNEGKTRFLGDPKLDEGIKRLHEQFGKDLRTHHNQLIDSDFSPDEIRGIQHEMNRAFEDIHRRHDMKDRFFVMDRKKGNGTTERMVFANGRYPTSSPLELMRITEALGTQESSSEKDRIIVKELANTFSRAFIVGIVMRDLRALEIPATYHELWNASERVTKRAVPDFGSATINQYATVEKIRRGIYEEILRKNRLERKERMRNEVITAVRKARLQRILSRFVFPRKERKQIYGRFVEEMRNRQDDVRNRKAGTEDDKKKTRKSSRNPVRMAANESFKRSRLYLRKELEKIGYNPDAIFSALRIDAEGVGERRYSTQSMRTLIVFARAFFRKKSPQDKAALVQSILKKYETKGQGNNGSGSSPPPAGIPRPDVSRNPRKAAKRALRRERARMANSEGAAPRAVEPAPILPTNLSEMVNRMRQVTRVTTAEYNQLRRLLRSTQPTSENHELIVQGLQYAILCMRASRFGTKGRVEERALRELVSPPRFHTQFSEALRGLMREGILQYEQHKDRNDFIALTPAAQSRIIAKFTHKKNN